MTDDLFYVVTRPFPPVGALPGDHICDRPIRDKAYLVRDLDLDLDGIALLIRAGAIKPLGQPKTLKRKRRGGLRLA